LSDAASVRVADLRVGELLALTSARTPTPGGGAIGAVTAALGAALAGMVVSYSIGRKDLAAFAPRLEHARAELEGWRAELLSLADADAEAYAKLNALQKLAPGDERRERELGAAVDGAVGVPVRCLRLCEKLSVLCQELAPITNRHLRSDLAVAAGLARAGAEAGAINARINLPLVEDQARRQAIEREVAGALVRTGEVAALVMAACR
jgi:formiminotetrahydrofolate cyclodeaminase